jgi:hypothetical protein
MKNLLLFILMTTFTIGLNAQKIYFPVKDYQQLAKHAIIDMKVPLNHSSDEVVPITKSTKNGNVTLIEIGKSGNIYYAYENGYWNNQNSLNFDVPSNLLQQVHRADPATYPEANNNTSSIMVSQSIDGGQTWTYKMILPFDEENYTRYPQSFISNTESLTNPTQVIIGATGPSHDGANWDKNFFVSTMNDEVLTGLTVSFFDNACNFDETYDAGICPTDDGYVYVMGKCRGKNAGGDLDTYKMNITRGIKDVDHIDFETNAIISTVDIWNSTYNNIFGASFGMAWANDGSIGYVYGHGISLGMENTTGSNPIVWKSTNSGESWELIETGMNMVNFPGLENDLLESPDGNFIPIFLGNTTGVVDSNGNLQFFGECYSGATLESPGESWDILEEGDFHGQLFNVTINPNDGIIGYENIGPLLSGLVTDDNEYSYADEIGWTNRMQASKSEDENAYFVIWGDTEDADINYGGVNAKPDIWVWGNRPNGNPIKPKQRITTGGTYWFHFAAGRVKSLGGDLFQIPISTTVTQIEMLVNTATDAVTIEYVDGVDFEVPVGITEDFTKNQIKVSQNQPNPFSENTLIEVSIEEKAELKLSIFNTLGQKIWTDSKGIVNAGSYHFEVSADKIESGIYFYTVQAKDTKITKKMIIRK